MNMLRAQIKELEDRVKWLEFNLAGANSEVSKGREQLKAAYEALKKIEDSDCEMKEWTIAREARERIDDFWASYID